MSPVYGNQMNRDMPKSPNPNSKLRDTPTALYNALRSLFMRNAATLDSIDGLFKATSRSVPAPDSELWRGDFLERGGPRVIGPDWKPVLFIFLFWSSTLDPVPQAREACCQSSLDQDWAETVG